MAAQVIPLFQRARPVSHDWTQREIAEFYRVESALLQAGVELESERGMTDEGDPWFVFCRADTGEAFIHFAREDGRYVVDGGPFGAPARGDDFAALVRELIGRHPLAAARRGGSNVFIHPAALLIALVGACFFHSGQAKAAETAEGHAARAPDPAHRRTALVLANGGAPPAGLDSHAVALEASQVAAILTAVAIGLRDAPAAAAPAAAVELPAPALLALPAFAGSAVDAAHASSTAGAPAADFGRGVLAVVAVLHDVFRLESAAVAAVANAATPVGVDTTPVAALLPSAVNVAAPERADSALSADPILLVVRLSPGELPHVEAVELVQGSGVLKLVADHIDRISQLPAVIADAILHGEHINADLLEAHLGQGSGAGAHPAPPGATEITPAPDALAGPLSGGGGAIGTPVPPVDLGGAGHEAPAAPPVVTPQPPPAAVTPGGDGVAVHGHNAAIDAAVLKFTVDTHAGVLITGSDVVFYDPQVFRPLAPGETLDSITFHFDDGSSISLVGTVTSLHDLHGFH